MKESRKPCFQIILLAGNDFARSLKMIFTIFALLLSLLLGFIIFTPYIFVFIATIGLAKAAAFETCIEIAALVCLAAKALWERLKPVSIAIVVLASLAVILMFVGTFPNVYQTVCFWFDSLYDKWFGWAW